jgi:hypothetical protein
VLIEFYSRSLHFCLVLDPVLKLDYLNAAWEEKYLEIGMKNFKSQVNFLNQYCFEFLIYFLVSCVQGKI